jgi:hypothetical protein
MADRESSRRVSGIRLSRWFSRDSVPDHEAGAEAEAGAVANVLVGLRYTFASGRHYEGTHGSRTVTVTIISDPVFGWRVDDDGSREYTVRALLEMYESLGYVCRVTVSPEKPFLKTLWSQLKRSISEMDGIAAPDGYMMDAIRQEKIENL